MKILKVESGFQQAVHLSTAGFFHSLGRLKGKLVFFRGCNEPGAFRAGYLKSFDDDTITLWNGRAGAMESEEWIYPYWEVMIAIDKTT